MECVSPRHLPPASELPSLLTYSRPPSNTTGFHRSTRFRSSSSRRNTPGDSHPTPLHRDGYHSAVSTETTAHYLPETLCARAPTFSANPPQVFLADSRIAATPSIAIWLVGFLDNVTDLSTIPLPPIPGFQDTSPRAICAPPETLADPSCCRYLRDNVSSLCEQRPYTCLLYTSDAADE